MVHVLLKPGLENFKHHLLGFVKKNTLSSEMYAFSWFHISDHSQISDGALNMYFKVMCYSSLVYKL